VSGAAESRTQSILAILAELSARRSTGTLRFEPEPGSELCLQFLFRKGRLLFATSNYPGERLGEFLVRRGILTEEEASLALSRARESGRFFHAHLLEEGLVPPEMLPDLLYQRLEELVDDILRAKDGHFVFRPDLPADPGPEDTPPWVDQELFGRLLVHRNVWPKLYQRLRDPSLVLRCHPGIKGSIAFHSLSEGERKLLALLDGKHPVSKILEGRKNRIDLMIVMSRFLESGLIEVVEPAAPAVARPAADAAPASAAEPAPKLLLVDEGPEGPDILFVEREQRSAAAEQAPVPPPAALPPEPAVPPAPAAAPGPRTPAASEQDLLLDEAVRLLEQFEDPLLDKAADLLQDAEEPALFDEELIPDDTDLLFQQVDALVEQAEGSVQDEALPPVAEQETEPQRAVPGRFAGEAPAPSLLPEQETAPLHVSPQARAAPPAPPRARPADALKTSAAAPQAAAPEPEPEPVLGPIITMRATPPARRADSGLDAPLDLDLVPKLMPGVRLAELSLTGLMMDDLALVSQIDGNSTIRELMAATQLKEPKARKVIRRLQEQGYISLQGHGAPRPRLQADRAAERPHTPQPSGGALQDRPQPDSAPKAEPAQRRTPVEQAADLYRRSIGSYNQDRFGRAEELLRACLSLVPNHALYQARLAVVLLERIGRDSEALRLAEEATEEDPLLGQAFEAKGLVKLKQGEIGEARRLLEKAMLLDKRKVPSSVAILAAMKTYKPKKGDPPDRLWKLIRPFVKLTP
jgi:tetratricopeptide (TPR) repeat protein